MNNGQNWWQTHSTPYIWRHLKENENYAVAAAVWTNSNEVFTHLLVDENAPHNKLIHWVEWFDSISFFFPSKIDIGLLRGHFSWCWQLFSFHFLYLPGPFRFLTLELKASVKIHFFNTFHCTIYHSSGKSVWTNVISWEAMVKQVRIQFRQMQRFSWFLPYPK